jgi:hypothetical protein
VYGLANKTGGHGLSPRWCRSLPGVPGAWHSQGLGRSPRARSTQSALTLGTACHSSSSAGSALLWDQAVRQRTAAGPRRSGERRHRAPLAWSAEDGRRARRRLAGSRRAAIAVRRTRYSLKRIVTDDVSEWTPTTASTCGFAMILHSPSWSRIRPKKPVPELTRQRSEVQLFPRPHSITLFHYTTAAHRRRPAARPTSAGS